MMILTRYGNRGNQGHAGPPLPHELGNQGHAGPPLPHQHGSPRWPLQEGNEGTAVPLLGRLRQRFGMGL